MHIHVSCSLLSRFTLNCYGLNDQKGKFGKICTRWKLTGLIRKINSLPDRERNYRISFACKKFLRNKACDIFHTESAVWQHFQLIQIREFSSPLFYDLI